MMLGKLLFSLLLCAPISAKYLTITAGSSDITTTQCKTLVGVSSKNSVPTYHFTNSALLPEIVLVLAVSTPASTVTPPAVTATDTLQTYTTATITASTATGTFSTTSTAFATESITTTDTIVSTTTSTTTSTSTSIIIEPAPSDWVSVENSTAREDRKDQTIRQDSDVQHPLQDDGFEVRAGWPPKLPTPPGIPGLKHSWTDLYPLSVTCLETIRTRYIKMIIFVKPHTTTTTIPPATSTTTYIQTVSSTSTVVPDRVTVIESFSTTSTTTTTLTSVVTETSSVTELVNATTTTTSYAACSTENLLGPKLEHGLIIRTTSFKDWVGTQDMTPVDNQYDCCVSCLLSSDNCQYSTLIYDNDPPMCGRMLNPAICRGQSYTTAEIIDVPDDPTIPGQSVSNGPCGMVTAPEPKSLVDRFPSENMAEL